MESALSFEFAPAGRFRIFDSNVTSQVPLPGLPEWSRGKAELEIRCGTAALDESGMELVHEWKESSGEVASACYRRDGEYLLRFPGLCDFLLSPESGQVIVYPHALLGAATLEHLLMDQVLPRLLFHRGRMVAHASAVKLADGRAWVFVGKSGAGKSSLAAYCAKAGLAMIADDTVQLKVGPSGAELIPAYPSLRLWPDMIDALFPDQSEFVSIAQYSSKMQRFELSRIQQTGDGSFKLAALVFLGNPDYEGPVQLRSMSGQDAAVSLLEALFTLDVYSSTMLARNLAWVGQIANSGIPVLRLDFTRYPSEWPLVLRAMGEAVPSLPG